MDVDSGVASEAEPRESVLLDGIDCFDKIGASFSIGKREGSMSSIAEVEFEVVSWRF